MVESFCAVELYLPDYLQDSAGRPLEPRPGLVLRQLGLRGIEAFPGPGRLAAALGQRTDEQMADLEGMVFAHEWNLPHDSALGMLVTRWCRNWPPG